MSEYISAHKYAKEKGTSLQNVYRWIREGKIKDVKREEVTVIRIRIRSEN